MFWKNKIKTIFLLGSLTGLFMLIGSLFGGTQGIALALIIAIIMNAIAYFFSDKIVLALYGAQPLAQETHQEIFHMIYELSNTMGIPVPKLWIIDTDMANAFATGRNPNNASIALTTGILRLLQPYELRGVLAHEMSHIYNRDILVGTIAAIIASAISYMAHTLRNMIWWDSHREKRTSNIFGMLISSILIPLAATIIQLSISRSREYLADETGAHACQDPLALASALHKLHNHTKGKVHENEHHAAHTALATLFIVSPLSATQGLMELFSTHPPLEKRIENLQKIYEKQTLS